MSQSQHSRSATFSSAKTSNLSEAVNPVDEHNFKDAYYKLCRKHRERRPEQYLGRLLNDYCANIINLADRIDDALGEDADTLSERFFPSLLGVIEAGLSSDLKLEAVISLFEDRDIPELIDLDEDDNIVYLRKPKVREPLEYIFEEVLEFYAVMDKTLREHCYSGNLNFEPITSRYDAASSNIEGWTKEWVEKLEEAKRVEAEREAERTRRELLSNSSVQNSLNGRPLPPEPLHIAFTFVRHLGIGRHSVVDAMEDSSGELVAQKVIRCDNMEAFQQMRNEVRKEVGCMRSLVHDHIPHILFGPIPNTEHRTYTICLWPVGDCHLGDFLPNFTDSYDHWFGCLMGALEHAHSRDIVHQDIKPSNIIIKGEEPLLTDFGSARDFSAQGTSMSNDDFIRGTPNYLAPEDVPGKLRNRKADIFSLGCVFSEMFTVRQGRTNEDFTSKRRTHRVEVAFPHAFRENLDFVKEWLFDLECDTTKSEEIRDCISDMLEKKINRRPKSQKLLSRLRELDMVCQRCRA